MENLREQRVEAFKENRIKTLEEDITKLFSKIIEIRKYEEKYYNYYARHLDKNGDIILPDYRSYRQLFNTLFDQFNTYKKLKKYKLDNDFVIDLMLKINNEIEEIHKLMDENQNRNYHEQYRTLSNIYNDLIELEDNTVDNNSNLHTSNGVENIQRPSFPTTKLQAIDYYKSYTTTDGKMKYTKKQVREIAKDKDKFYQILKENDIVFLYDVWESDIVRKDVGLYFKNIFALRQYRDLRWSDSVFTKLD